MGARDWGRGGKEKLFTGHQFLLGVIKMSRTRWWWLHHIANALNATDPAP